MKSIKLILGLHLSGKQYVAMLYEILDLVLLVIREFRQSLDYCLQLRDRRSCLANLVVSTPVALV